MQWRGSAEASGLASFLDTTIDTYYVFATNASQARYVSRCRFIPNLRHQVRHPGSCCPANFPSSARESRRLWSVLWRYCGLGLRRHNRLVWTIQLIDALWLFDAQFGHIRAVAIRAQVGLLLQLAGLWTIHYGYIFWNEHISVALSIMKFACGSCYRE